MSMFNSKKEFIKTFCVCGYYKKTDGDHGYNRHSINITGNKEDFMPTFQDLEDIVANAKVEHGFSEYALLNIFEIDN